MIGNDIVDLVAFRSDRLPRRQRVFLNPAEISWINQQSDRQLWTAAFWAAKESFAKAIDLQRFTPKSIHIEVTDERSFRVAQHPTFQGIWEINPEQFIHAVCTSGTVATQAVAPCKKANSQQVRQLAESVLDLPEGKWGKYATGRPFWDHPETKDGLVWSFSHDGRWVAVVVVQQPTIISESGRSRVGSNASK